MQIINRKKGKLKLKIKFSLAAALFEDILTDKLRLTVVLHKLGRYVLKLNLMTSNKQGFYRRYRY